MCGLASVKDDLSGALGSREEQRREWFVPPGAPRVSIEKCPQGQFQQQRGVPGGIKAVAAGWMHGKLSRWGRNTVARVSECHGTWKGSGV